MEAERQGQKVSEMIDDPMALMAGAVVAEKPISPNIAFDPVTGERGIHFTLEHQSAEGPIHVFLDAKDIAAITRLWVKQ